MTEEEMVGWHHWLDGHEFEQAPGAGDGQGSLACCSPWGGSQTRLSDWTELNTIFSVDSFVSLLSCTYTPPAPRVGLFLPLHASCLLPRSLPPGLQWKLTVPSWGSDWCSLSRWSLLFKSCLNKNINFLRLNIIGIERYYDFDVLQNAENYFTKVFQTLNKILKDLSAKNKQKKHIEM